MPSSAYLSVRRGLVGNADEEATRVNHDVDGQGVQALCRVATRSEVSAYETGGTNGGDRWGAGADGARRTVPEERE